MTIKQNKIAQTSIKELIYAGAHFGHKKKRWNPKMAPFIFGSKGDIHIIDLAKTKIMLDSALHYVASLAKNNGKILFVGTKHQASPVIKEFAANSGQYYVNHRWLGGMLTNWSTVSNSIKTLVDLEKDLNDPEKKIIKKERLQMQKKYDKLSASLGGIREMKGKPHAIFVVDTIKESIAIKEAAKLDIPIIAITDTNSDLDNIAYPIPGNDDSIKSISLFCKYIADTINMSKKTGSAAVVKKENLAENKKLEVGINTKNEAVDEVAVENSEVEVEKKSEKAKVTSKTAPKKTTAKKKKVDGESKKVEKVEKAEKDIVEKEVSDKKLEGKKADAEESADLA